MSDPAKLMLKNDPGFRRLNVGGRGWNGMASYWLGPDHLLVVEVSNYAERYRRFYFRDIQAVVVQANRLRLIYHLVLAVPLVLCLVVLTAGFVESSGRGMRGDDWIGLIGWGIPAGLFLLGMLLNHHRGPTCVCLLRTAVQIQKLKNINRWRATVKLLEPLQTATLAAQAVAETTSPGNSVVPPAAGTESPPTGNPIA